MQSYREHGGMELRKVVASQLLDASLGPQQPFKTVFRGCALLHRCVVRVLVELAMAANSVPEGPVIPNPEAKARRIMSKNEVPVRENEAGSPSGAQWTSCHRSPTERIG